MKNTLNLKGSILVLIAAVFFIAVIAGGYMIQLNKTISQNIIENIKELAEHDRGNIQSYIKSQWRDLEYIEGKFKSNDCRTIEDAETLMNVECANSSFSHIYMVGEDGKTYTDKFITYDPTKTNQSGRIDLLPFFENGKERVVRRFDDKLLAAGLTRESVLYGIRTDDLEVDGIKMVALVGITDISKIQDRIVINSFISNGVSHGYSTVINMIGNYIVNDGRTVYINEKTNFFERIAAAKETDFNVDEIKLKMENREEFAFSFTEDDGLKRIIYCIPFYDKDISWYFLLTVDKTVFDEQNKTFLTMSMIMMICVVMVVIFFLCVVMVSRNRVIAANAQAKARSDFLANMSHEIRTPLNGIIGLIYLIERDIDDKQKKDKVKQRLVKAEGTANYLLSLINNVLDISKIQAGKVDINNDIISPEMIADAVWSMQKVNIDNLGVEFIFEKNITVPWIIGDDVLIKRVLMNIVGNAAKFTPAGGRIRLAVTQEKESANMVATIFTCEDTGCGMSEDFVKHIWDAFSQESSNCENGTKGTGLGMAISKMLVEAMNGEILVESKKNVGSKFTVIIHSQIADKVSDDMMASDEKKDKDEERNIKILVAEDNELNADILIEILKGVNIDVVYAANGREAVEKFEESMPGEIDIILMDMQMPLMDGCEATAEIRKLERPDAREIQIIACTANGFNEDRERALASGMNDFMTKPIDVNILLQKLGGGEKWTSNR